MKNRTKSVFIFVVVVVFVLKAYSGYGQHTASPSNIRFTENKNQWNKNVLYRAQLDGGALFLEKTGFTYGFYDKAAMSENNSKKANLEPTRKHAFKMTFLNAQKDVEITATQPTTDHNNYFIGKDKSKWATNVRNFKEVNYKNIYDGIGLQILGSENSIKYTFYVAPQKDAGNIQLFYEGLTAIALDNGTLKLTTTLNELVEQHPFAYQQIGEKQVEVPCEFAIEHSTVHFYFPKGYDKNYELVIDPVLVFAATSGSTASNFGHCATYDVDGNLYSGGIAFSQGYPTTLGAYDTTFNANSFSGIDVVITKYDSSGTFLQYSTYLGGSTSSQIVTSLIVDAQNDLVLYGVTGSTDFPVTPNAYDTTFNGGTPYMPNIHNGNYFLNGTDIFVAKFNTTGSSLLASTYIGGSGNDGVNTNNIGTVLIGYLYDPATGMYDIPLNSTDLDSLEYNYGDYYRGEIDLDASGNVVVATASRSTNFPIINGFDNTLGGQQDAVVFEFNTNLSQLIWSTYLGGNDNDCANSIALDNSADVYVTGGTRSSNFPTTSGALQTSYNGGSADGYVTKIKQDGSSALFSTLWGTSGYDQSYFVQLDKKNDVYLFGQTDSLMPVTSGVYNNPNSGQFITKMNDSLNTLIFSTVFGNSDSVPNISPTAFLVDNCENIYVSGWPTAFDGNVPPAKGMAIIPNALDSTTTGYKFYLMALTSNASSLLYSTYFGGNQSQLHCHGGTSRYDKKGVVYQSLCTGCGGLQDYPVSPGAYPLSVGGSVNGAAASGGCNNGVFKFDFQTPLAIANFNMDVQNGCVPQTIHFTNKSTKATTFLWDFGGGDTTSTVSNPVRTFSLSGTYIVKLFVNNPATCNVLDSVFYYVTVKPSPALTGSYNDTICNGATVQVNPFTSNVPSSFTWIASPNPNITGEDTTLQYTNTITDTLINITTVNQTVIYTITPTSIADGCAGPSQTFSVTVIPSINVSINSDTTVCNKHALNIPLTSNISSSYSWVATNNPNTTGESTTPQSSNTINNTITNNTAIIQPVIYTITPTSVTGNCVGAIKTFTVFVNPTPVMSVNNDTTICNKGILNLLLTSNIPSSFAWIASPNPNTTGESTTLQNSNLINDSITNKSPVDQIIAYTVTPTSTIGNCVGSSETFSVTIRPAIIAKFGFTHNACIQQATFADSSKYSPVRWLWNFGDDSTSTLQNPPPHIYNIPEKYDVSLTAYNTSGCKSTYSITIDFSEPEVSVSPAVAICTNDQTQLQATGGVAYKWSPITNLNNSSIANPIANPSITTTYSVIITTATPLGDSCNQTLSTTVNVTNPALYSVSATVDKDTLIQGQSTTMHAITTPSLTVTWSPAQGISDVHSFNPTVTPDSTTTYTVSILDAQNCPKMATVFIYVISSSCGSSYIFVPNTFTPNGDGVNDVLYVRGSNITDLYFAVYNRWGQPVFETTDLNKGWNGVYNGLESSPVVFAWYLKAKCYNGDTIEKKGNVTLIR